MLEMKKAIDRIENEIKMVRARKETALGGGRSGSVKLMEEEGAVVNAGGSGKQTSRAGSVKVRDQIPFLFSLSFFRKGQF